MTIKQFFTQNPKTAVAFSGGVDSAYLIYLAKKYAKQVRAYYVCSEFQPQFEKADAVRLANELECDLTIIETSVLENENVKSNPPDRCYHCKKMIFGEILKRAKADGFSVLLDGTNASDKTEDRPGMKALSELEVLSPLRLCGYSKDEIRSLSKKAGLFTWNKPSYACLATRIKNGTEIKKEMLEKTEKAEDFLRTLGFENFRIRYIDSSAKIELRKNQPDLLFEKRNEITAELKKYYKTVLLDLEVHEDAD